MDLFVLEREREEVRVFISMCLYHYTVTKHSFCMASVCVRTVSSSNEFM